MRLRRLRISGVQSLADVEMQGLGPVNFLVGPNGAGKSSVFRSLEFAYGVLSQQWTLHDGRQFISAHNAGFPWSSRLPGAPPPACDLDFELNASDIGFVRAGYAFPSGIELNTLHVALALSPRRLLAVDISSQPLVSDGKPVDDSRLTGPMAAHILNQLRQRLSFLSIPAFRRLQVEGVAHRADAKATGEGMKQYLHTLANGTPMQIALFKRIQWVFRDVTGDAVSFRSLIRDGTGSGLHLASFNPELEDQTYDLEESGDGLQELVVLIASILSARPGALVGIEEPELHLHPGALRRLIDFVAGEAEHHQVLVATHSAALLDRASSAPVFRLDTSHGETSIVREDPTDWYSGTLAALGLRRSDAFMARGLLFVEGDTDVSLLRAWASSGGPDLERSGALVIAVRGKRNMEYFAEGQAVRALGGPAGALPVAFLRDRDELYGDALIRARERYERLGPCLILSRREIENYLLEPAVIAAAVTDERARGGGDPVNAEEVRRAIEADADRLRVFVIARHLNPRELRVPDGNRLMNQLEGIDADDDEALVDVLTGLLAGPFIDRDAVRTSLREQVRPVRHLVDDRWREFGPAAEAPGSRLLPMVMQRFGSSLGVLDLAARTPVPAEISAFLAAFAESCRRA